MNLKPRLRDRFGSSLGGILVPAHVYFGLKKASSAMKVCCHVFKDLAIGCVRYACTPGARGSWGCCCDTGSRYL